MIKFNIIFNIFILIIATIGCGQYSETSETLISKEKYIEILSEMQLLEAYGSLPSSQQPFVRDSIDYFYEGIFEKYKTTRLAFFNTTQYYAKNPIEMSEIYDLVIENLTTQKSKFDYLDESLAPQIMAFSMQQVCEIAYKAPITNMLLKDSITTDKYRDSLFSYLTSNDSILQTFGVNLESFKYSYIINTTQKVLYEQFLAQLKQIDERTKHTLSSKKNNTKTAN